MVVCFLGFYEKELKTDLNAAKTSSQWKSFIKKGMTPKGIYFALRYFYDIQKMILKIIKKELELYLMFIMIRENIGMSKK